MKHNKGLALIIGLGKGKSRHEDEREDHLDELADEERSYAKETLAALKDDDEEGFVKAIDGLVKACIERATEGEYKH